MRALVVFHGLGTGAFARLLAPGFGHCFVALDDGRYWIVVDGRNGVPEVKVAAAAIFDLAAFYRQCGFTVVATESAARAPHQPLMLGTCVGAAKRLLGLRAPHVVTPHQLWRHLNGSDAVLRRDLGRETRAHRARDTFLAVWRCVGNRGFQRLSKWRLTRGPKKGYNSHNGKGG